MAVTFGAHLGSIYDGVDRGVYTFTVTGVTAGRVAFLAVALRGAVAPTTTVTPSGLGMTWTAQHTLLSLTEYGRLSLFTGVGTPSGTTLTITLDADDAAACLISLADFAGVDTADPVEQSAGFADWGTTSALVTLGAVPTSGAVYGAHYHHANENVVPGSGWTEIGDVGGAAGEIDRLQSQYQLANDRTSDWTWATNGPHTNLAVEIRAAAVARKRLTLLGVS